MSTFKNGADAPRPSGGRGDARAPQATAGGPAADLSSLLHYPSLGRLFEGDDRSALEETRARLTRTNQDLERVIRQGPKDDAERAARASRAVSVTLELLDSLEQIRREGGGK